METMCDKLPKEEEETATPVSYKSNNETETDSLTSINSEPFKDVNVREMIKRFNSTPPPNAGEINSIVSDENEQSQRLEFSTDLRSSLDLELDSGSGNDSQSDSSLYTPNGTKISKSSNRSHGEKEKIMQSRGVLVRAEDIDNVNGNDDNSDGRPSQHNLSICESETQLNNNGENELSLNSESSGSDVIRNCDSNVLEEETFESYTTIVKTADGVRILVDTICYKEITKNRN